MKYWLVIANKKYMREKFMVLFEKTSVDLRKTDAEHYTGMSQKIKIITEKWVCQSIFFPSCGSDIKQSY